MKIINSCPFNLEDGKTRILWEITPRCNMKCKHCLFFNNNCKDLKKELTTEEVFKIIDNVCKDTSVKAIWISGGEPLLRNDIVEICKYIKSKNIKPSLSSNGILLNKQLINDLYNAGVEYIHLSLDGSNAATHNKLRGVDNAFEELMRVLDLLKDSKIHKGASFMVTEESISEIEDILNIAKEKQLDVMSFYLVAELGRGAKNFKNDKTILSQKLADKMNSIDQTKYKNTKIEVFRTDMHNCEDEKVLQECKGYNFLNITYDGNLGACPWLMKSEFGFEVGSLLEEDFVSLKEKCVEKMKSVIQSRKQNIEYCKSCKNEKYCGKGCVALQVNINNNYNGVDPICPRISNTK